MNCYRPYSELSAHDRVRVATLKYVISHSMEELQKKIAAGDWYGAELEAVELAQSFARLDERLSDGVIRESANKI